MKKNKKEKQPLDPKEIIITIVVLIISIVLGFFIGKVMFETLYGSV